MDIGIYNLKYPFRKMIQFLLPYFKNTHPDSISLCLIPLGLITAIIYYFAPSYPIFYWLGVLCIILRMTIGTLDGLVAVSYNKQSAKGEMINRLTPEVADIMLLIAIILASPHWQLGIFVMGICWGISYAGLIGLAGGKTTQSVGPVGQTDRIAILIIFSILQFFSLRNTWGFDFINLFLWWVLLGGMLTIGIRCYRVLVEK